MFSSVTMQKTEGDFRENLRAKYCNDKYIRDVYGMLGWDLAFCSKINFGRIIRMGESYVISGIKPIIAQIFNMVRKS